MPSVLCSAHIWRPPPVTCTAMLRLPCLLLPQGRLLSACTSSVHGGWLYCCVTQGGPHHQRASAQFSRAGREPVRRARGVAAGHREYSRHRGCARSSACLSNVWTDTELAVWYNHLVLKKLCRPALSECPCMTTRVYRTQPPVQNWPSPRDLDHSLHAHFVHTSLDVELAP